MRAQFVNENILNELSVNSTLYHRSSKEMKVGELIKSKKNKKGIHWLEKIPFEIAMEKFRKEYYPNVPSRLNAIYCSIIPRSRFKDKGYLYVIKPIGNILMTNSRIIDKMGEQFNRDYYDIIERRFINYSNGKKYMEEHPQELFNILNHLDAERYWKGKSYGDKEGTEVLCENAIITEVIGIKKDHLLNKDIVEVIENNKLRAETTIYLDKEEIKKYKNKDPEILKFVERFKSLYNNPQKKLTEYAGSYGGGNLRIGEFIKKGVILQIVSAESSMRDPKYYNYNTEQRVNYKYIRIKFLPSRKIIGKKPLLKFSMEYFYVYTKNIRNITKYLKKI